MTAAMTATLQISERQLRVEHGDAARALAAVAGQPVIPARARLRFGPGRTCEALARVLDAAITRAERAGLDPAFLVVAGGAAEPDEDIVRVRRKAHGKADWIHSPTSHVRMTLQPAGLHSSLGGNAAPAAAGDGAAGDGAAGDGAAGPAAAFRGCVTDPGDERAVAVREALFEVIDPDLGVNVVDLGFVRAVRTDGGTAVITMTLTSAACPLTGVLEDQIRAELAGLPGVAGFRVEWVWLPAWRPADMTDSGREQLRAIGFSF
jgi:metal-sulfur cluster biosynthetic enzyme/ribosomal protein L22